MTEEALSAMGMAEREATRAQFERLVGLYGAAISRAARSYAKTVHEREDLEQNIGLALWQALPSFRAECSERTFVLRIAHNQALSHITRRRARPVEDELDDEAPAGHLDPEALAGLNEQMRSVFRAMHALPIAQRQVLALALEGLSHDEIGVVVGISASNVAVRVSRARAELRRRMGDSHD